MLYLHVKPFNLIDYPVTLTTQSKAWLLNSWRKRVIVQKQNGEKSSSRTQIALWLWIKASFISSQETCVNRQLPANQPCTILQTSCNWNVCIQWLCKRLYFTERVKEKEQLQTSKHSKRQRMCAGNVLPRWECRKDTCSTEQESKLVF